MVELNIGMHLIYLRLVPFVGCTNDAGLLVAVHLFVVFNVLILVIKSI